MESKADWDLNSGQDIIIRPFFQAGYIVYIIVNYIFISFDTIGVLQCCVCVFFFSFFQVCTQNYIRRSAPIVTDSTFHFTIFW